MSLSMGCFFIVPSDVKRGWNMNFCIKIHHVWGLCLFLFGVSFSWADASFTVHQLQGQYKKEARPLLVKEKKVRMELEGFRGMQQGYILFDVVKRTVTHVNQHEKSYTVIDEKTFEQLSNTLNNLQKSVLSQLNGKLESGHHQAMEAMISQLDLQSQSLTQKKSQRSVRETDRTKTIAGYVCKIYEQYEGKHKRAEICTLEAQALGVLEQDLEAIIEFYEFIKAMASKLPGGQSLMSQMQLWELAERAIPLHVTKYKEGEASEIESVHQVSKVDMRTLNVALFQVPKGYKQKQATSSYSKPFNQ